MALTLSTLKSKALVYFRDRTDLATYMQDGVDFATDYFSQKLRVREMMTQATLTPDVDGICTLPDDFIELISVTEDIGYGVPLDQMTDVGIGATYYAGTTGIGYNYKVFGDTLRLYPSSENDVVILYYATIPALVEGDVGTETNWLLEKFPNAYLDYVRMWAADIADEGGNHEAKYAGKVDNFIETLNDRHQTSMYARVTTDLSDEVIIP